MANEPADRTEKLTDETKAADRRDAHAEGAADRMPTPDEERRAERHDVDPEVRASYKEMAERGARQEGEGRIEG